MATVTINFVIVAVFYFGGSAIGTGEMEIGDITAVVEYAIWILFYVMMVQMTILMMPRALASLRRVFAVLVCRPEIVDGPAVRQGKPGAPVLAFEAVTFRFADADEETISGLSFSCLRGTTTAIIGGTGSGKSTVAKLLLRFHDVTVGRITLFGQDIRDISQVALRACISYVPQKAWLFSGTVAENLRYADPDASEETLRRSLRIAQADFVLDEATSSVDTRTEIEIGQAMKALMNGRTSFVIAHRLSTIVDADLILVMHEGGIIEQGDHRTLLAAGGAYAELYNSQFA